MKRLALLVSLLAIASVPAFGYNLVNSSWTQVCVFSTTCSVTVTDYSPTILGSGKLQTRIYQGQPGSTGAGKYVYEYRIDLTQVAGLTSIPYVDEIAIYNTSTPLMFNYNFDAVSTDQVYVITSGGLGTKGLSSSFLSGGYSYFVTSSPIYGGNFPGDGETSYFFGFASNYPPTLRTIWVHTDTGWITVTGYAPNAP
ncbi:MAG TPA: hypothetical protein VIG78_06095 [Gemmatimonadaceae bacterium]